MLRPPAVQTRAQMRAFQRALVSPKRQVRFRAKLFRRDNRGMPTKLDLVDGEVVIDTQNELEAPSRTAHVTLYDPNKKLLMNVKRTFRNKLWFNHQLGLWAGVWVRDWPVGGTTISRWVDVPLFRGWITEVGRKDDFVEVDCVGRDGQHTGDYVFPESFSVRKGTRVSQAIQQIARQRGERKLDLAVVHRRLATDKTWAVGHSPWKAMKKLAASVDMELYFRGDGSLKLRREQERPVWVFTERQNGVILDRPEIRHSLVDTYNLVIVRGERDVKVLKTFNTTLTNYSISGEDHIYVRSSKNLTKKATIRVEGESRVVDGDWSSGNPVLLTEPLSSPHPVGAAVSYTAKVDRDRPKRVYGRAELPRKHPLSAGALTDGRRPRVLIIDDGNVNTHAHAQYKSEKKLNRMKFGVDVSVGFSCIPIWILEENDLIAIRSGGVKARFAIQRMVIPLSIDGKMEVNWEGERRPKSWRRLERIPMTYTKTRQFIDRPGRKNDKKRTVFHPVGTTVPKTIVKGNHGGGKKDHGNHIH